jgi:mRNA-degrading endonuclease RelE of RelBE toxin-antitoxin system
MDKIAKALQKLRPEEKKAVRGILVQLAKGQDKDLDRKKLKGRYDIFRIRKGKIRIIYRQAANGRIFILIIERRSDTTYNF